MKDQIENSKNRNSRTNRSNISGKRTNTMSKRLDNVESMLQIEKKNKKLFQAKFDKKLQDIDMTKEGLEKELNETIKTLNDEENKIYEIQKANLDKFKAEILKYENIYHEIGAKAEAIASQLSQSENVENMLYNQTSMIREDFLSYSNELVLLRDKVKVYLENLKQIENSYPKEFKSMQEEFQLETDMKTMANQLKSNIKSIKDIQNEIIKSCSLREGLLKQIVVLESEDEENIKMLNNLNADDTLEKLENHITKNISDIIIWENLKDIIHDYFTEKKEIGNKDFSERLSKSLEKNLDRAKSELLQIKKEKIAEKNSLYEQIEKLKNSNNKKENTYNEIAYLQDQLEKIISILTNIDNDSKDLNNLFTKYIVLIKNKTTDAEDFERRFKMEIISLMTRESKLSNEEIEDVMNLIEIFFKEMEKKNAQLKELQSKINKTNDQVTQLNTEIDLINEKIGNNEKTIKNLKNENLQLEKNIKNVKELISIRNKNLKTNLESLGDAQFQVYLDNNEEVLKNMKKIYGTKILNKVFKVQKEKFLENVIVDHSIKKSKVTEYISFITQYEDNVNFYKKEIENLELNYQTLIQKYESCLQFISTKTKEKNVLDESNKDLKDKMQIILEDQVKDIEIEKNKLQIKHNVFFYIEKIKDLKKQIEELTARRAALIEDFERVQKEYNEREHKLEYDHIDIQNSIHSIINPEDPRPSVLRQRDSTKRSSNSQINSYTGPIMSIDETIRRSLIDFTKKGYDFEAEKEMSQVGKAETPDNLTQKLKPLICGLTLYKKFDNNLVSSRRKEFDPFKAGNAQPEEYGYGKRLFRFNTKDEVIEVKCLNRTSGNHCEMRFSIYELKGIFLTSQGKQIVKAKEGNSSNPTKQTELLCKNDFITFTLALLDSKYDLIAPNYLTFTAFECAIREIITNINYMTEIINELKL